MTHHLDPILADLTVGLDRRAARRRRLRAIRTATAGAAAAVALATSTVGLVREQPVTQTADARPVLGLTACERDAFGCLKLAKAPQD